MKPLELVKITVAFAVLAIAISGCTASAPTGTQPLKTCGFSGNTADLKDNQWDPGYLVANQISPEIGGVINKLSMHVSAPTSFIIAIYSDASGKPGALMAQTGVKEAAGAGWISAQINPVPVIAGEKYWIVSVGSATGVSCLEETQAGCYFSQIGWDEASISGLPENAEGESWDGYVSSNLVYADICCMQ